MDEFSPVMQDPDLLFIGIADRPVFHWSATAPHPFQVTGNGSAVFRLGTRTRFWGPVRQLNSAKAFLKWEAFENPHGEE